MNRTKIEWVLNPDGTPGYTFNPITGCLNGCDYCYARKLANWRLKQRYLANKNYASNHRLHIPCRSVPTDDPFYPRFWPERLADLRYYKNHRIYNKGIFVCDMSDLFGIGIPESWTKQIMRLIELNHNHRFYLPTKQPQNLQKFSPFPDNAWVGVSATDYDMMLNALNELCQIEASIKYISFEPLLSWQNPYSSYELCDFFEAQQLDWLIIGACTKPYRPPKIEWVQEIVESADRAGVPVFLKDNLKPLLGDNLRQEFPNG